MTRPHNFSRKIKAEAHVRAKGCCEQCWAKLKTGEGEVDHILPVALGGESIIENARLLCKVCHTGKTANDVGRIRKADRQRDRHTGAIRPKGNIRSPGFPPRQKQAGAASSPIRKSCGFDRFNWSNADE